MPNRPLKAPRSETTPEKPDDKAASRKPEATNQAEGDNPSQVEGEGSYTAARRHRKSVEDYIEGHDVEQDARNAAPDDARQAQEMEEAERKGKRHARH